VYPVYRANMNSHYVGFELFGFDILLDSKLKPWLIEGPILRNSISAEYLSDKFPTKKQNKNLSEHYG
jgi:hypothetical protein